MNGTQETNSPVEIPVVCTLCGTRLYALPEQIGQTIRCPDCDTDHLVRAPAVVPRQRPAAPEDQADAYRLQPEEGAPAAPPPAKPIKVVCHVCQTLMYASSQHVGKRVRCPDCGAATPIVQPVVQPPAPFRAPNVDDLNLEPVTEEVNPEQKAHADRLLQRAAERLHELEKDKPTPPKRPFTTGIFSFLFYPDVFLCWVALAASTVLVWEMLAGIAAMTASPSLVMIMAVFVTIITTLVGCALVLLTIPPLLTILEFTAEGRDRIPYWPSRDLLERTRDLLIIGHSVALGVAPGMLLVMALPVSGIPNWLGLLSGPLVTPFVLLSMIDMNSPFLPYSTRVYASLRYARDGWRVFYLQTCAIGLGVALLVAVLGSGTLMSRVLAVTLVTGYVIYWFRLLGRLAWVIVDRMPEEPDDEELGDETDEFST